MIEKIIIGEEVIIVDKEDFNDVLEKSWHIGNIGGNKYCKHSYRDGGQVLTLYLHDFVTNKKYKVCGFKDGDTLNCSKDNLYDKSEHYDVVL